MQLITEDEQEALINYIEAKKDADRAQERLAQAEANLLVQMQAHKRKNLTLASEGRKFSATYTQRTTNEIDESGLRKALTASVFDKFTVKKLDRKALERAMSDGDIDPVVVAQFVKQVPGKTFVTYRVKEVEDDEA